MQYAVFATWLLMFLGILFGVVLGMNLHKEGWAGGYSSFRRRIFRLGHLCPMALGIITLLYMNGPFSSQFETRLIGIGTILMLIGGYLMPVVCLLMAWRQKYRFYFIIPVSCVVIAMAMRVWIQAMLALDSSIRPY